MEMAIGAGWIRADAKYAKYNHKIFEHGGPSLAHQADGNGRSP
jgi:hypothetical protein